MCHYRRHRLSFHLPLAWCATMEDIGCPSACRTVQEPNHKQCAYARTDPTTQENESVSSLSWTLGPLAYAFSDFGWLGIEFCQSSLVCLELFMPGADDSHAAFCPAHSAPKGPFQPCLALSSGDSSLALDVVVLQVVVRET